MDSIIVGFPIYIPQAFIEEVMNSPKAPTVNRHEFTVECLGPDPREPTSQDVRISSDHPGGFYAAGIAAISLINVVDKKLGIK